MSRTMLLPLSLLAGICLLTGCYGSSPSGSGSSASGDGAAANVKFPEGDTSVSPELGGPGFTGAGWTTSDPGPLGDPRAVKGGTMLTDVPNWPENLRMYGTGSNTYLNAVIQDLCYGSLCDLSPHTLEFVPRLASHWKISDDKMTFTFRINPKAHWSDGEPVTAEDVIATYRLIADETLVDPMNRETIVGKMKEPVAKSKYIVEVECKEKNWRNFITFATMVILPAHEITDLTGKEYLDKYNFKLTAVCGPYMLRAEDIKTNESLTLTRRPDYWGIDEPRNTGLYNFDKIRFVVVRDQRLGFDKACKGELDFIAVYTAKWWVEDLPDLDAVKQGHLIRQKVFTNYPQGFQGMVLNMRNAPLDDVRVRKAMAHLYDRKTMLAKFAYNEYVPLSSYFPGSDYENHENQPVAYDPREADRLLEEAGWSSRGSDGIRTKNGKRLSFTLLYRTPSFDKYLTSYQEACKQAGVEINLQLITPETHWQNMMDRKFEIASMAWGAVLFPSPRTMWHSGMADEKGSNNLAGFKNAEADRFIEQYDREFDLNKRRELLRQLDAIIFNEHPYVLDWYLPCERVLYWNKFGTPDTVLPRYADWRAVFSYWWADPSKEQTLKAARKSGAPITPIPPLELHPWPQEGEKTAGLDRRAR